MKTACIDLSHRNTNVDFGKLKAANVAGVILKATQGAGEVDNTFAERYTRAISVFGKPYVHAYHFLDNTDAVAQMKHFVAATPGVAFRWLDYEVNPNGETCTLSTAIAACHSLQAMQKAYPGMYGSDAAELGDALDEGHFTVCPLWIASYRNAPPPAHKCDLWQYNEQGSIAGMTGVDLSAYIGSGGCKAWMQKLVLNQ